MSIRVYEWIDNGYLPDRYTHTDIERIRFRRQGLDRSTKLDRSPDFGETLLVDGRRANASFLDEREGASSDYT